mmetsp:Transcript_7731/g.12744  ORF Transcript_7731/g.12744 Transcript_7731/m.12744 type:complete len:683 (-) Transcript_7731:152-2200(-)
MMRRQRGTKLRRSSEMMLLCVSFLTVAALSISATDARAWGLLKKCSHRRFCNVHHSSLLSDDESTIQRDCNEKSLLCRGGYADYIGDGDSPWADDDDEQQMTHHMQHQQQPNRGDQNQMNYPPSHQQQQQPRQQMYGQQQPPPQSPWQQNNNGPPMQQQGGQRYDGAPPQQQHPYSQQHPQQRNTDMQQRGPPQQYQRPPYQQQQQQQYSPPDFPGDAPGGPGFARSQNQNNAPSRIQNAGMQHHHSPPYGFDEEEDDDDDLLPSRNGLGTEGDDGIELQQSDSSQAGSGMDLSQFNKDIIFSGLKRLYRKKIRPLELSSKFGHFHSPPLSPSDFDSKPMVLLLGQYSVGKTSFIRYLLGRDFPGQRIGPEPTTDRFVAILKGDSGDKIIPGAALCSQGDRPFRGLSPFGNNFLSRFEGVEMDSPILNNITLVDTPGILSGQKQSIGRNYDYEQVMKWFAERADLIIIMFDAHKLDISDELKRVIEILKPHQDKMRVILNKADSISTQQLMRVYGALMWSLGKVMMTPEVCRVYMGSFWGAPLKNKEQAGLLTQEKIDLFNDIAQLPQNAVMRRINELVKRARSVKVHAYIIHYLRKQLPYTWGKREKQRRLIDRLEREFVMCARRYELPRGDFPELEPFRQALLEIKDLSEIHKLDKKMVKEMDKVFSVDIPNLLEAARNA